MSMSTIHVGAAALSGRVYVFKTREVIHGRPESLLEALDKRDATDEALVAVACHLAHDAPHGAEAVIHINGILIVFFGCALKVIRNKGRVIEHVSVKLDRIANSIITDGLNSWDPRDLEDARVSLKIGKAYSKGEIV